MHPSAGTPSVRQLFWRFHDRLIDVQRLSRDSLPTVLRLHLLVAGLSHLLASSIVSEQLVDRRRQLTWGLRRKQPVGSFINDRGDRWDSAPNHRFAHRPGLDKYPAEAFLHRR